MADMAAIASIVSAGGTLVLAVATFGAVRSANTAARTAERSLMAGLRPLLVQGRMGDPPAKVLWQDRHAVKIDGGRAYAAVGDDVIYLAMTLHNVGSGIALLNCWYVHPETAFSDVPHADLDEFTRLTIDLYIPAGDAGYWEGAVRDVAHPIYEPLAKAVDAREPFSVDLLYGDQEGGQRTISRFTILAFGEDGWYCQAVRHWNLDRPDPRPRPDS
jgi:hypothetical protein